MKMSNSSKNIKEKNIENQEKEKPSKRGSYKKDYIKEEIYKKLNEGTILHFIRNSKKSLEKTNFSKNVLFVQKDTNKKTGEMLHSGILMKTWVENMKYIYYICSKYLDCDE